ncbi:GNAT family N-acetyltransferase [Massilia violaceinigra]|uniref:GNAT family N-acetyltransferase n=1 Tax=Massilia violaceinigra TaxID=2045208 RepID=A0A2D2DE81_9BURK|nr:GNAT family N-acetyltransferase [Massilia violaceinigra]ATQ73263.1 GNAT family N-acetyltransferase [Massilia violaceinigra]
MAGEAIIRAAASEDLDTFFAYLNDHLRDNGSGATALFMPMARAASRFGPEREHAFRSATGTALGQPGWRRLWLAFDAQGGIAGHIDLRARPEGACAHRALLGMGVHRDARKQGLGARLIGVAATWAASEAGLDWIDLEVLSVNVPARELYVRCGFVQTGEIADMFRIDGEALAYTFMSRKVGKL